jgi:hypothetical protein
MLYSTGIHVHRGDLARAQRLIAENRDIGESENPDFSAGYHLIAALVRAAEGRTDDALAGIRLGLSVEAGGNPLWILFNAFEAAGSIDDADIVRELLSVLDELRPGELTTVLQAQQARFRARLPEHDAEAELATAERLFVELEMTFQRAVVQLELAEHLDAQGRGDEAAPIAAAAAETFALLGATPWLARTARLGARVPA